MRDTQLEAIQRRYPWEPTALRALVLGAGPIGLLGAMMLVARNVETFVYSLEPADSDRAGLTRSSVQRARIRSRIVENRSALR